MTRLICSFNGTAVRGSVVRLFVLAAASICSAQLAAAATVTVNTKSDVADGVTTSIAALKAKPGKDGVISLREAITAANNTPGTDTIEFNIPGSGLQTITLESVLPVITSPVIIDGYTQPGSKANTRAVGNDSVHLIELNGNSAVCGALVITAGKSTIRGLVINRFNGNCGNTAILLETLGGNTVEGCFLGLNAAGTAASTNRDYGVRIESSPNNLIGGTTPAARNVIAGNNTGITINGDASSGTTIQGNYIGTNAAGMAPLSTGGVSQSVTGININTNIQAAGPSNTTIGGTVAGARNVIGGHPAGNINLFGSTASGNVIQGNYIGINAAGTAAVGLSGGGVVLTYSSNIVIGGTTPGARNVISGNSDGIDLGGNSDFPATNNLVQGNLIGTNAAGNAAVPNGNGISISEGHDNTIGGTTAAARNIISGNSSRGVSLTTSYNAPVATANVIRGNFIGTDITGTAKLGNGGDAIVVAGIFGATLSGVNTIGGTTPGARNIISASGGAGIALGTVNNTVIQGNFIGTDVNGTANFGNGGVGISLGGASNNMIGGVSAGAGNVIAFNGSAVASYPGVAVYSGTGNSILGNSIFSNAHIGIDLSGGTENAGVTANDSGDADDGANGLQNYPVLKTSVIEGNDLHVTGTLNSTANTVFRIEFFGNDVIDPSGFGEGKTFLGFANVTTNGNGDAAFDVVLANAAGLRVTATATDPSGNTSEFSPSFGQLLNISTRLRVDTGENVLIGGFIITRPEPKKVIVRALGPSLPGTDQLQDPTLELHDSHGIIATNDNWRDSQEAAIKATHIPPPNDAESAIVRTLPANAAGYTAIVRGKNDTTGTALVEVYDLDQAADSELANISTRGLVEGGNNLLIGGFIAGNGVTRVIIRALGPSLDVAQPLPDPILELHDGNGGVLATNDNWRDTQEAEITATHIPPPNNAESAIIATLPPGGYTAVVRDVNSNVGVALVEVYRL